MGAADLARLYVVHKDKYSPEQQRKIRQHIKASANVNLANPSAGTSAQGETGKTRAQPRQYGGRFGVKGEMVTFTPKQISEAIDNLKPGQSINLPDNVGKVKRLTNGFQIVSANGANVVVPNAQAAATRANGMVKSKGVPK